MRRKILRNKQKSFSLSFKTIHFSLNRKYVFWGCCGLFILVQVYFTIQTATTGAVLANLERQETQLNSENTELSEKLINSTSLTSIEEKAGNLGFAQPKQVIYLNTDEFAVKLP